MQSKTVSVFVSVSVSIPLASSAVPSSPSPSTCARLASPSGRRDPSRVPAAWGTMSGARLGARWPENVNADRDRRHGGHTGSRHDGESGLTRRLRHRRRGPRRSNTHSGVVAHRGRPVGKAWTDNPLERRPDCIPPIQVECGLVLLVWMLVKANLDLATCSANTLAVAGPRACYAEVNVPISAEAMRNRNASPCHSTTP